MTGIQWIGLALLGCLSGHSLAQQLTARQVIAKIQQAAHVTPVLDTVDTFKAGDPDARVTGVVTTFLDTYAVMERAVADGRNLIITHEPTFYNHLDDKSMLQGDPVEMQKEEYARQHRLIVWRFHDGWHSMQPDGILLGFTNAVGWQAYQEKADVHLYTLPETTVADLAAVLERKLGAHALRVVGDPKMHVTRVAVLPGAAGEEKQVHLLERGDVEVLIAGEAREWQTVEYVRDAAAQGRHKALLLLGHEASEEPGMQYCAEWLRTVLPGTPVEFVPAADPFWTPAAH